MNISNRIALNALSVSLLTGFMEGMAGGAPETPSAPNLFYEDTAIGEMEADIPWLTTSPRLKKWNGPQEKQRLSVNRLVVTPERYSLLLAMGMTELENDKQAKFIKVAQSNGSNMGDFNERLAFDLLNAGTDVVGGPVDGTKKFFDTGRKVAPEMGAKSPTYDNLVTGVLDATTFGSGVTKLLTMTDGAGTNLGYGLRGYNLMVGAANRSAGLTLINAMNMASGASNVNYKAADLVVSPYITGTKWFLQAKTPPRAKRPLTLVTFARLRTRITTDNDYPALNDDEIWWQLYTRLRASYGDPQTIIGGTGA